MGASTCYVLCDTLVSELHVICVRDACLATMAFAAFFAPWFSENCTMSWIKPYGVARSQHHCLSNSRRTAEGPASSPTPPPQ